MGNISLVTCSFVGKGYSSNAFVHYAPIVHVKPNVNDWKLGLGMHNFRKLEKKGNISNYRSNQVKVVKKIKSEKSGINVELVRRLKRENGFRGGYTGRVISVKKSIYAEESVVSISHYLRNVHKLYVRTDGRRERFTCKQKNRLVRRTVASRRNLLTVSKAVGSLVLNRVQKRRLWLREKSYNKLPTMYLANIGPKGFKMYCTLVRLLGFGYAFWLINNWKTEEAKSIYVKFNNIGKKVHQEAFRSILDKTVIPKPERKSFPNFKKWSEAVRIWQKFFWLCRFCYKKLYQMEFNEELGMWKGANRYDMTTYAFGPGKVENFCSHCKRSIKDCTTELR